MKTVTVIAEDRVALLADISYVLGKSNINIDGLNVEIVGGKAVISLSVRDPKKARDILARNGYNTTDMDAIVIKVHDHVSGGMAAITERLSKAKVHIENLSMLSSSASEGVFALQVDKPRKAAKLLRDAVLLNQNSSYA
jgi:hypothetical protein